MRVHGPTGLLTRRASKTRAEPRTRSVQKSMHRLFDVMLRMAHRVLSENGKSCGGWRRVFSPCLAEEPSVRGGSGESAHQLKYLVGLRRSCVVRCVILGGEHPQLCRAHDFEGTGRSEHQLAEFLVTVKMHATAFIELSLLLMQHTPHADPSTNECTAAQEGASSEES